MTEERAPRRRRPPRTLSAAAAAAAVAPGPGPESTPEPHAWTAGPCDAITDVPGIRVGHWSARKAGTGCTVILCETARFAAADARGGAPGTREIDVLAMGNAVRTCHAILFSGGSAFGLGAADGVVRWCAEEGIGFETKVARVPIVSGAVIFDLGYIRADAAPAAAAGYDAARRAAAGPVEQGSVGVGTGATVAKLLGPENAAKGGVGTASLVGPRGIVVGALAVTNAVGYVVDPDTGDVLAAPRGADGHPVPIPDALALRTAQMDELAQAAAMENTTLVCVATNARLQHHEVQRLATHAHDGLARTIVPAHTFADGDVAFAVAMDQVDVQPHDTLTIGMLAMRAVEVAILRSVRTAGAMRR